MNQTIEDQSGLEEQLSKLSQGQGLPGTQLWWNAFSSSKGCVDTDSSDTTRFKVRTLPGLVRTRIGRVAAVLVVTVGLFFIISSLMQPSSRARRTATDSDAMYSMGKMPARMEGRLSGSMPAPADGYRFESPAEDAEGIVEDRAIWLSANRRAMAQNDLPAAPRSVIRKATVEMRTDDVRGVFHKITMLVNEGRGEFIEESSLTGETEHSPSAEIKLRVVSDRLSEVMNELRQLGEVVRENVVGDDVTDQLIDLEARLRNEYCVEAELLELLESQKNAELKDILQLRNEIGKVRGEIERLLAQQARINELVALSTILVIVRHAEASDETESSGIGAYFKEVLANAWESSMLTLADSIAWIVYVLLGGILWWTIALAAVTTAIVAYRRSKRTVET